MSEVTFHFCGYIELHSVQSLISSRTFEWVQPCFDDKKTSKSWTPNHGVGMLDVLHFQK